MIYMLAFLVNVTADKTSITRNQTIRPHSLSVSYQFQYENSMDHQGTV